MFTFGLDKEGKHRVVMDYQVERCDGNTVSKRVVEFIEQMLDNFLRPEPFDMPGKDVLSGLHCVYSQQFAKDWIDRELDRVFP